MTTKDFTRWLKDFFVEVTFTDSQIDRIEVMLGKLTKERVVTQVKQVERIKVVREKVYVERKPDQVVKVPLADIAAEVCSNHGITIQSLTGRSRYRDMVYARKAFIDKALSTYPYTAVELARFLKRDHSSILYLKNRHKGGYEEIIKTEI
jgi:chromosomal replication initiation ATPase DnaA